MARITRVTGVSTVIANLRKNQAKIGLGVGRGLKIAGLFLQRESQKIVPVQFGVLRNAAFTRSRGIGAGTEVLVGYDQSASYAIFVHENLQARHKAGKQAKFLEAPLKQNRLKIRAIIREAGRVGL